MATKDSGVWKAEDCALVLIGYQPAMVEVIRSETNADMVQLHARLLAKTAKARTASRIAFYVLAATAAVGAVIAAVVIQPQPSEAEHEPEVAEPQVAVAFQYTPLSRHAAAEHGSAA